GDANTPSGIKWACSARARAPASTRSHSISTPVAVTARIVASATSGPIPSPGMRVIRWAITVIIELGVRLDSRLGDRTPRNGGKATAPPRHSRRARAGRHGGDSARGIRTGGVAPDVLLG